jgi:hypothetical protein
VCFIAGAFFGCAKKPPDPEEYCQTHLGQTVTIIVVDRTTKWDPASTEKFNNGLDAVLQSRDALGLVKYVEVRNSEAQVTVTPIDTCILPAVPDDYRQLLPQEEKSRVFPNRCSMEDARPMTGHLLIFN